MSNEFESKEFENHGDFEDINESENTGRSKGNDESMLKGLLEDRLMSMMRIRSSMEKVIQDQKDEESLLREYIKSGVENLGSRGGFGNDEDEKEKESIGILRRRIEELEKKYQKEFEKRVKLSKAFVNFKTEGGSIVERLRFALRQITAKYKKEMNKNRQLSKKLNQTLIDGTEVSDDEKIRKLKQILNVTNNELQKYKVQFGRIEEKFMNYKKMHIEHKKVILALRKKLERIQKENEHLRQQIGFVQNDYNNQQQQMMMNNNNNSQPKPQPKSTQPKPQPKDDVLMENKVVDLQKNDEESFEVEEDPEILYKLQKYVGKEGYSEVAKKDPKILVKEQNELIKKLLNRLSNEENDRLKTEEQSFKMVEEEERTINFLESQIKNLTSDSQLMKGDESTEHIEPMKENLN